MTHETAAAATAFAAAFETRERPDGESFVRLTDDAPQWMRDAVQGAHWPAAPCDWIYEACRHAIDYIAECGPDDDCTDGDSAHDWADGYVDVYYHKLATWLAEAPGAWDYCDEWIQEQGQCAAPDAGLSAALMGGQYLMLRSIFDTLAGACAEQDEEMGADA